MSSSSTAVALSEIAEIQPKVMLDRGEEYPFIEMADVTPHRKHVSPGTARVWQGKGGAKFENGDVLLARITPCLEHGKAVLVCDLADSKGFGSTEFFVLRAREGRADSHFLYYLTKSPIIRAPAIKSMTGASGRQRASRTVLESIQIPAVALPVQQRIGSLLSNYDDLIENNTRRIKLLEDAARLLHEEWFVRLRFPGHEHTPVNDGVPEGWERVPTPDAIHINPKTKLSNAAEHWWVEMGNLPLNSMVIQSARLRDGRSGSKFQNGDTLFARITPCLENGKTAYVDFLDDGQVARGSTEFIVLRSKRLTPEYVYCLARTYAFRHNAIKSMIGASGRQRVQESCFDKFRVLVPPTPLMNAFTDTARPIFRQIRTLHLASRRARETRDLLLPRLMSGEVAV